MNCENCKFYVDHGPRGFGHKQGTCHRYPESKFKMKVDWCGEYRAKRAVPKAKKKEKLDQLFAKSDQKLTT